MSRKIKTSPTYKTQSVTQAIDTQTRSRCTRGDVSTARKLISYSGILRQKMIY
jgi:hypothetical protein